MCKSLSYSDHRKGDVEMGKRKKKIATHAINAQGQQSIKVVESTFPDTLNSDSLKNRRQEYLNLAKKFHVPINVVIGHYDILLKQDNSRDT